MAEHEDRSENTTELTSREIAMKRTVLEITLNLGGATFDRDLNIVSCGSGYAVGLARGTAGTADRPEQVDPMIRRVLREYEAEFVGTWLTPEGTIAIDPVAIVETLNVAIAMAQQHHQRAIYSFREGRVIPVSRAGECDRCGNLLTITDPSTPCKQCRLERKA